MDPTSLVIFGFTGDLVKRKLLPSLYHLEMDGELTDQVAIVGIVRRDISLDDLKQEVAGFISDSEGDCKESCLNALFDRISIVKSDVTKKEECPRITSYLNELDATTPRNRVFYFAIPPTVFERVVDNLVAANLHITGEGAMTRLLIEKPFGNDVSSASNLINTINQTFGEKHVYHIDHYLAKETVQNVLYFRFHNPLIRAIWSGAHIKQIQVSATEAIDIQGRADFYEQTGVLRDMIQSHLLQVLALATMDEPASLEADDIRRQRQILLQSLTPINMGEAIRGQYDGYREEVGNNESNIETFVQLKLGIDNVRWRGVPVYLKAGKALDQKLTEITMVYSDNDMPDCEDNVLTIRIQPNEGVAIKLTSKKPGLNDDVQDIMLDFCYEGTNAVLHDAYEKILLDAMHGDQTLFPTDEEIMSNWRLVEPLIKQWHTNDEGLHSYKKYSKGPDEAEFALDEAGTTWISLPNICKPVFKKK